jgi:hypothetical protein
MSLRRFYHHHVKHHQRFNVAVFLTIVAVAWVAVPPVSDVFNTIGLYDPRAYEPKDAERAEWLARRDVLALPQVSWENLGKVALIIFVGLAWLAVTPRARPGRSSRR